MKKTKSKTTRYFANCSFYENQTNCYIIFDSLSLAFTSLARFDLNIKFQRSQNTESASFDGISYQSERYKKLQTRQQRRKTKRRIDYSQQKSVNIHWSSRVRLFYVLHVVMRLAMELVFFYTSYLLQTYQTKVSDIEKFKVFVVMYAKVIDFRKLDSSKYGLYPTLISALTACSMLTVQMPVLR